MVVSLTSPGIQSITDTELAVKVARDTNDLVKRGFAGPACSVASSSSRGTAAASSAARPATVQAGGSSLPPQIRLPVGRTAMVGLSLDDELQRRLGGAAPERTLRQFAATLARLRAAGHREMEQTA
jgi:hypothetical protein